MTIRRYEMRHHSGETVGLRAFRHLCERHLEARQALGYVVDAITDPRWPNEPCGDCDEPVTDTVLDRVIAEADAEAAANEPKPVPVLPGQRSLFGDGK
jgi:hypothetical protein